jgi:hypothetical protein
VAQNISLPLSIKIFRRIILGGVSMNKFEEVYEIQKQYKRGVRSYSDAIRGIKEVFSMIITKQYAEWLLLEYCFN